MIRSWTNMILSFLLIFILVSENLTLKYKHQLEKTEKNIVIKTHSSNIEDISFSTVSNEIVSLIQDFDHLGLLIEICRTYDVDWKLALVIIYHESKFNENAISPTGAKGLMQITRWVYSDKADPFDPGQNILIGINYIKYLQEEFMFIENDLERLKIVIAAYHDGVTKVKKHLRGSELAYSSIIPHMSSDGKKYVRRVINSYQEFL